jgi:hypothetical protein
VRGDGSAYAFRCSGDDRDFACEFFAEVCGHMFVLSVLCFLFELLLKE